jgi:hypothetical protein
MEDKIFLSQEQIKTIAEYIADKILEKYTHKTYGYDRRRYLKILRMKKKSL